MPIFPFTYTNRIEIHCKGCGLVHDVKRTDDIPAKAIRMNCNWCPECESEATDYFHEWPTYQTKPKGAKSPIEQRRLQFRFDHG